MADSTNEKAPKAASKAAAAKAETTEAATKPAKATTKAAAAKGDAAEKPAKAAKTAKAEKVEAPVVDEAPRGLKVHHLRPAPGSHTPKTRVGRGEGSKGKTAGRGTKGTKARYQVSAGFEGGQMPMHMRLPKLRGFKNPFRTEYQVVNLERLATLFPKGGDVSIDDLVAAGAVRANRPVKVLGDGDLAGVKLNLTVDGFSASAKEKIEAAGGSISRA